MQITDIETRLVRARGDGDSGPSDDTWYFCLLWIRTDEGISGVGEVTVPGLERAAEMAVRDLGRELVGRDPLNVEGLWDRLYTGYSWNWGPVSTSALSGLEMALWDLAGKYHGLRVCDLLGGPRTERLALYANGGWGSTPAALAATAAERREKGYDAIKIKPFAAGGTRVWPTRRERNAAVERLEAVRDAVGDDVEIAVDMRGAMAPRAAIDCARLAEPFDPLFVEEPVPPENHDAMRRIRDRIDAPIATGERLLTTFDYRDFLRHPAPADVLQPDVTHCGGISQLKKIAAMAYTEYLPIAPHNSGGPIATAATAHAAATIPNFFVLEYFPDSPAWRQELIETPESVADGVFRLPEGPGLGVEVDEDALRRYSFNETARKAASYDDRYREFRG